MPIGLTEFFRQEGLPPRLGNELRYGGHLPDSWTLIISGRRFIRPEHVGDVRAKLVQLGKLPAEDVARQIGAADTEKGQ
jgi:hypothetical protein